VEADNEGDLLYDLESIHCLILCIVAARDFLLEYILEVLASVKLHKGEGRSGFMVMLISCESLHTTHS